MLIYLHKLQSKQAPNLQHLFFKIKIAIEQSIQCRLFIWKYQDENKSCV